MINLTSTQLRQAAELKERIEALETELAGLFGNEIPVPLKIVEPGIPAKRTMSPAHKAKIRAAQKLRWAKHNAAKAKPVAKPISKPAKKRTMSAAAKAAISAAAKARWAKISKRHP